MKITITSTSKIVDLNRGVQARIWEGHTDSGIPVQPGSRRRSTRTNRNSSASYRRMSRRPVR